MTSRSYCFTSFTVSKWDREIIAQLMNSPTSKVRYLVYQIEECPTTSRLHAQGYIEFISPVREVAVKNFFSDPAMRLFKRNGSPAQARHYCMCSGPSCNCGDDRRFSKIVKAGPFEFGNFGVKQGQRTDLLAVQTALNAGATMKEIAINHFPTFARFEHALRSYQNLIIAPRNFKTEVHIYWGSVDAAAEIKESIYKKHAFESFYPLNHGNAKTLWFDGYEPLVHENIYIENYNGWIDFDSLLALAGNLPCNVPIKGSCIPFVAKRIYISAYNPPRYWYDERYLEISALFRLVNCVRYFYKVEGIIGSVIHDLSEELRKFYIEQTPTITVPTLINMTENLTIGQSKIENTNSVTEDRSFIPKDKEIPTDIDFASYKQREPVILDPYTLKPMNSEEIKNLEKSKKKINAQPTVSYGRKLLTVRPRIPEFLGYI